MSSYVQRVGDKAQQIQPVRILLAALASPLYAVGWVVGMIVVAFLWLFAAAAVGFSDARDRARRRS